MRKTPEGFLLCIDVPIGRTGEMVYGKDEIDLEPNSEGKIIVMREEKELFNDATMSSFEGKPITISHPNDFVNPDNWRDLSKGIMQHVRRGKDSQRDDLICDLLIMDAVGIGLVENGLREVSLGYLADFEQEEPGKGTQVNIRGNHLALVQEGRAGRSYAINDHKGKEVNSMPKKFSEKVKSIFTKAADEAAKIVDEADKEEGKKSGDEEMPSMDAIMQACKDLGEKIEAMSSKMSPKAGDEEKKEEKKPEEKSGDEDVAPGLEDRLKALEASVAKILEAMSGEEAGDEEEEEMGDEDESEEAGDEEVVKTGDAALDEDTLSRAEILAPGLKASAKDIKVKALKKAFETADGKKILEKLNGSKGELVLDSASKIDTMFIAASEILKGTRSESLSNMKRKSFDSALVSDLSSSGMTPTQMNEINAKHFGLKN